jgi:phosphatidylinositol alpha-1,6-mannosyltransferase
MANLLPETPGDRVRPRILWVTSEFTPRRGGIETLTATTVEALAARATVAVVTGPRQAPATEAVHHLAAIELARCADADAFAAAGAALRIAARDFAPDAIHLASAGLAVFAPALGDLAPVFVTVHCKDLTAPWQQRPGGDVRGEIAAGLAAATMVIAVSDYTAGHVRRAAPGARITVMTPGLVHGPAEPTAIAAAVRRPGRDRPRILTVCRLVERKGIDRLADALARVDRPFEWHVAGDGPLRDALAERCAAVGIADRVVWHGALSDARLASLYESADLFALTPREIHTPEGLDAEGFGLVYLEAAAFALPSLAGSRGGSAEAVADGVTGLVVDPDDAEAVAAALDRLLASPALRREMGLAALGRLHTAFRTADRVSALMDHYHRAARRFRPRLALAAGQTPGRC